jgi:glucokinase
LRFVGKNPVDITTKTGLKPAKREYAPMWVYSSENISGMCLLGIDIGGTKSAASLLAYDNASEIFLLWRQAVPTPAQADAETLLAFLVSLAREALQVVQAKHIPVAGVGVSAGAPAWGEHGIVFAAPNMPGWGVDGFPLAERLSQEIGGLLVRMENDADATALAEWRFGAGQGTRNMAFLTVGTGIGSGLILNGALHRGAFGAGGEIGHICVETNGRLCKCGLRGCLEAYASGPALVQIAQERGYAGTPDGLSVTQAARAGDVACQQAFAQAALMLGRGLATLTMLLNLECIVLGTMAVHAADLLLEPVQYHLRELSWPRLVKDVRVVPAALGDRAQDLAAFCAFGEK